VAGNLARVPTKTLNQLAGIYLVSRAAFNLLYIYGTNSEYSLCVGGRTPGSLLSHHATFLRFTLLRFASPCFASLLSGC
jgi:uncharacterized MAPEG superfamily protein